jgi:tetratricopeptide (TPR) repeat protein
VVAAVYASLVAAEGDDRRLYLLCGGLVGAAGAVRLNGLLSGLILLVIHLAYPAIKESTIKESTSAIGRLMKRVWNPHLWLSGLAAVTVVLVIQPYLITDPSRLTQSLTPDDLAYSISVARGEFLRVWSLVDVHTVFYLHFWTDLMPTGVGWPLTLAFLAAIGHALWRPRLHTTILVLWLALYFIPIGALHTKHVRYLLPMLPFLGLLFGDMVRQLAAAAAAGPPRYGVLVASGLIMVYTGLYGIAFTGIYHTEDSRIEARRWLDDNLAPGSRVAVEHGGFSMRGVLALPERYRQVSLNMGLLFGSRGYRSCEATTAILQHQLAEAEYLVITDVNRYRPFTAVPELYPVVAAFYTDLVNGELGFELVRRFKVYPEFAGITFADDAAEPSFIGYDHPAVMVLRKTASFSEETWPSWAQRVHTGDECGYRALADVAEALAAGQLEITLERTRVLQQAQPSLRFAAMIEAFVLQRLDRPALAAAAAQRYASGYGDPSLSPYLIAAATAISLTCAGLDDIALAVLDEAASRKQKFAAAAHAPMARAYGLVAQLQQRDNKLESAYQVSLLAAQLHPAAQSYNALGELSAVLGNYDRALEWWDRSLIQDGAQLRVHRQVAQAAFAASDYKRVIDHLQRVLQLDRGMNTLKRRNTLNLLGDLSNSTGQLDQAAGFWRNSLFIADDQAQIHRDLGLLPVRQNADVVLALMHLEKATELAPPMREQLHDTIAQLKASRER